MQIFAARPRSEGGLEQPPPPPGLLRLQTSPGWIGLNFKALLVLAQHNCDICVCDGGGGGGGKYGTVAHYFHKIWPLHADDMNSILK